MGSSVPAGTPGIGDVLYLHDKLTRLSMKNVKRWCVVVATVGQHVRVVGRSASRRTGVFTPAGTMQEFDRDGGFWSGERANIPHRGLPRPQNRQAARAVPLERESPALGLANRKIRPAWRKADPDWAATDVRVVAAATSVVLDEP